jgi:hypothetical protein
MRAIAFGFLVVLIFLLVPLFIGGLLIEWLS